MKQFFLIFLLLFSRMNAMDCQLALKKMHAQLVIDNPQEAIRIGEKTLRQYPDELALQKLYLMALSEDQREKQAIQFFDEMVRKNPKVLEDREIIRNLGWGVLRKSLRSSQPQIRIMGLIGSYLTQDVRAVQVIKQCMQDSHDIIRLIAVELASYYRDQVLQDQLLDLIETEKNEKVRIYAIRSMGKMQMKSAKHLLEKNLEHENKSAEERAACVQALLEVYDGLDLKKIETLSKSPFAGLRRFACEIATYQKSDEAKKIIWKLLDDPRTDVRLSALNSLGLYFRKIFPKEILKKKILEKTRDIDPTVAMTACWILLITDPKAGQEKIEPWLYHEIHLHRYFAAAVVAASGEENIPFMHSIMEEHQDPFVAANLALGCMGFRVHIDESCDVLYHCCQKKTGLWMMDETRNPLFSVLSPSFIRFTDSIPNYPQAIDQMTRIKILSMLAMVEDPRAQEAIRKFLQSRKWGITGFAAATLLKEGDEDAMKHVRDLLKDPDPYIQVQSALILAFFFKDPSVISFLQKSYETVDHEMKLYILEALGTIPAQESKHFLLKGFKEPFQNLRIAASASLLQSMR